LDSLVDKHLFSQCAYKSLIPEKSEKTEKNWCSVLERFKNSRGRSRSWFFWTESEVDWGICAASNW